MHTDRSSLDTHDPRSVTLMVVDDQPALRDGLMRLIASSGLPLNGLFAAASLVEALAIVQRHAPDVIVLDVDLAGEDGLSLMRQLSGHESVLVLSSQDDAATRHRALALGAAGFARKSDPARSLVAQLAALIGH